MCNGEPSFKGEDIIKVALKDTRMEIVDWINLIEEKIM
jgi:hypothetical protein